MPHLPHIEKGGWKGLKRFPIGIINLPAEEGSLLIAGLISSLNVPRLPKVHGDRNKVAVLGFLVVTVIKIVIHHRTRAARGDEVASPCIKTSGTSGIAAVKNSVSKPLN